MLKHQNSSRLAYFFFFLLVTLLGLIFCLFALRIIALQEFQSDNARYESYLIADRLRQSSDDLTAMARLYVSTGEKKYREYYKEILAIRNGTAPRPLKYDEIYWDLVMDNKRPKPYGPPKSLEAMMLEHHFTLQEFALLSDAVNKSDLLSQLEIKAMNLYEGKYQDSAGKYTIIGKPNPQLAQKILFDETYMQTKANVMRPIQVFFDQVSSRTKATTDHLDAKMSKVILLAISLSILSTILMLISIFQALKSLSKANTENDLLLLNILPEAIASRLKLGEEDIADEFAQASVMFADIINFTELTEQLGAKKTVTILNQIFAELDNLTEQYHIEKVKTIGDNYMAVSGIPIQSTEHAKNMANYALAILEKMKPFNKSRQLNLQFRIGMTYGTVIAGVIGHKKFVYDVWGNVVNLASRLEESSLPNKIHISEKMAFMLEDEFILEPREEQIIRGVGKLKTYFLLGKKEIDQTKNQAES